MLPQEYPRLTASQGCDRTAEVGSRTSLCGRVVLQVRCNSKNDRLCIMSYVRLLGWGGGGCSGYLVASTGEELRCADA